MIRRTTLILAAVTIFLSCSSPPTPEPTEEPAPPPVYLADIIANARWEAFEIVVDRMRNGQTAAERYEAAKLILSAAQYRGPGAWGYDARTTPNYRTEPPRSD